MEVIMKIKHIFLTIGSAMIIGALTFVIYALGHPEMSAPFSMTKTYVIYLSYVSIAIGLIITSIILFVRDKKHKQISK